MGAMFRPMRHFSGQLKQRRTRRTLMFWLTLTLLLLSFSGATMLKVPLGAVAPLFLVYWSGVAVLAIALILLSGYDMIRVPRELRREHRLPSQPH
jgi:hypothetical protein